ncbi:acyl-CoA dehydrogenase family protein [Pseudomonas deceptionensis]|uniref:Acyl-CoA dehydrogenase n=1 Tax=Pseudomonas deceptionensis TaxID=882211 RepID=A0A0J6GGA1_PSEDM|nr:acyl-CoA dehydrogenase family protein [Pseudomonas deceptionensis]KMM81318.1 acyl-CoA dehydrogenase [Pseudomonas deceptionensis]SEE78319.1 hypothetical protein SAMN04489800_2164 [Pseudomonas deceptionensis]
MNVDWQGAGDIQAIFGTLIDEELNRTVEERDRLSIPISNALIEKFARLGLYKYNLPTVWGGQEVGYAKWGHVLEKLGYLSTDLSFPFLVSVRMSFISFLIAVGRKDINDEYLNNLIAGKTGGAFAYTEDADAFSFVSRAVPAPDGETYTVNAVKKIVTGGETANYFLLFVHGETTDMQVFLVHADDPGVVVTPSVMHGCRSTGIACLTLTDVRLDKQRLLLATDGLSFAQRYFLNCRRSLQTTLFLGRARAVIETTVAYLQKTIRYDQQLIDMQHVQACIGEMYMALESSRTLVHYSLERQVRQESDLYWDAIASMAKYQAVEEVNKIALKALNLTGGWGYSESSGIGRAHRDFTALVAGADPQEKLKVDMGIRLVHDLDMMSQRFSKKESQT